MTVLQMAPPDRPLHGVTVLATRPIEQVGRLADALRAEGAEVLEVPAIIIEPPDSWEALDQAVARDQYHWVIFTSANGVRFFAQRLRALGQDNSWFTGTRLAAIGPETARTLAVAGLRADLVPDEFVAEALLAALSDSTPLEGQRVLLPRADIARAALAEGLIREGAIVDQVAVYRTVAAKPPAELIERLARQRVDVVTFTSSSTVRSLVTMLGPDASLLDQCAIACIGPVTAATAREQGLRPRIIATTYTIPGLVAAIRHHCEEQRSGARPEEAP